VSRAVQRFAVRGAFGVVVLLFCAAPTPGDVGGCNQRAQELDPTAFFETKRGVDCERCRECNLSSKACDAACDGSGEDSFPRRCVPLVHDGEVCLRALLDASCDEYRGHMRDEGATTPTECNFCPTSAP